MSNNILVVQRNMGVAPHKLVVDSILVVVDSKYIVAGHIPLTTMPLQILLRLFSFSLPCYLPWVTDIAAHPPAVAQLKLME